MGRKVVFVGGATIDLFITDPGAPATRPTDDVDCVVELAARTGFHRLEEELRSLGFKHDTRKDAPMCRWVFCGIRVDVMPTNGGVLGFKNRWYPDGMAKAETMTLPDGEEVASFSAPYLLASKLEAFHDRGKGDFLASADLEDIVVLLDGCLQVESKVAAAPADVRAYLAEEFATLLGDERFLQGLEGHLPYGAEGPARAERCLGIMRRLAGK